MDFQLLEPLRQVETIAQGAGIRELARLRRTYSPGRWRKWERVARVRPADGVVRLAELHWYEARGIGRHGLKIKRYLDQPHPPASPRHGACSASPSATLRTTRTAGRGQHTRQAPRARPPARPPGRATELVALGGCTPERRER